MNCLKQEEKNPSKLAGTHQRKPKECDVYTEVHIISLILKYSQFHSHNCEHKQPFLCHRKQDRPGNQRPHFITKACTTEIRIDYLECLLSRVDLYVVDIWETCWKDINE